MQLGQDVTIKWRSEARMFFSFVTYGIFRLVLLQAMITEKKTVKICVKIAISPSYVERNRFRKYFGIRFIEIFVKLV